MQINWLVSIWCGTLVVNGLKKYVISKNHKENKSALMFESIKMAEPLKRSDPIKRSDTIKRLETIKW